MFRHFHADTVPAIIILTFFPMTPLPAEYSAHFSHAGLNISTTRARRSRIAPVRRFSSWARIRPLFRAALGRADCVQ